MRNSFIVKDSEETIKKIKVKVRGVNSLPRELRIIVNFDDQGQAIGEAQALLAGFLGTLAADCKLFPMDYDRWSGPSGVPKAYFDDCFETILKVCLLCYITYYTYTSVFSLFVFPHFLFLLHYIIYHT